MHRVTAVAAGGPGSRAPATTLRIVLTVFLPFTTGYYLSYLYRSVNAVIAPQLIADIGLTASDLGLLTAAYFLAFAAFQLPLGLLLDRFGPRRVQSVLLLSAALGAAVFGLGDSKAVLVAGRALIGLGVAGGLMASLKAITLWFPRERWPLVNGWFVAMGGLGAMSATAPVEALLQVTDWRGLFFGLSAATLAASALIYVVVPERPASGASGESAAQPQAAGLGRIYRDPLFWRLAPLGATCFAAQMAIQGLWAGPWLRDVAGFDRDQVAGTLLLLTGAMTAGFLLTGLVADFLGRRGVGLASILAVGTALLLLAQAVIVLGVMPRSPWPWLLMGLTANMAILIFPMLSGHFGVASAGRANTAFNVMVFSGAFGAQYAIGWIIDFWPLAPGGGFLPAAYSAALGIVLALETAAFAWFLIAGRRPGASLR